MKTRKSEDRPFNYKIYNTLTSLAGLYGISIRTFYNWIGPLRKSKKVYPDNYFRKAKRRSLTPNEIDLIIDFLGEPHLTTKIKK